MFRRKSKRKNSFLSLHFSNRGSDIVRPDNTSLVVNKSEPEADDLLKELTSILSEDEDDNLEGVGRKSSSLMRSLSQKTQSTPLGRAFSENKVLNKIEEPRSRSLKSKLFCSVKLTVSSGAQKISYFEEVLRAGGAVPLPGNSSFLISEDQAVFSIKVNNKLIESSGNVEKFVDSISKNIKDKKNLQKMLTHTLTTENCEVARGPVQEPLIRMLLNVDCLQVDLVELLLTIISDLVVDNNVEDDNVQLISSILRQMRFLNGIKGLKITSKLFEIIHVATVNVKREIIFMLPEIISEEETEKTCIQLMDLLKSDESLTYVIVDTLASLPLNKSLRSLVCSKILPRLDKCPVEFLPSLVQFILNKCHAEELHEIINGFRNSLPFTPQHLQMKNIKSKRGNENSDKESYLKLTFESLRFSAMASKEMSNAWIKIIQNLNFPPDFSCLLGKKNQILQLVRNKIKSSVLTQVQVKNMFKILVVITEEYYSTILEMASTFFKSSEPKISSFGALLYKECFVHFNFYMKQIVISEILLHIGTGSPAAMNIALCTLKELCESEKEVLSQHTTSIMGLLIKVQDLELRQVRLLVDVIANLVFFDSGRETVAQNELRMFIQKQLISPKLELCKKGISAAVIFSEHYTKESDFENTDWDHVNSLLEFAMDLKGSSETKRGFFNDEFGTMIVRSKLSESFLKIWSEKMYNLISDSLFVRNINMDCTDFPVSLQYDLSAEGVQKLIFPVAELIIRSNDGISINLSVPVIPSSLRLLWCLEKNLNRLLPVFYASIIMPVTTVYDNFKSFDDSQKKKILDCLFLCGNYLIECINALCTHGILDKAILRLKQLISVRKLIAKYICHCPEFVPPICQFYAPAQKVLVKKKTSDCEKRVRKGRKRKLEAANETLNSSLESQPILGISAAHSEEDIFLAEKPPQEADLHQHLRFFRELDSVSHILLATDLKSNLKPKMKGISKVADDAVNHELETCDILFLLEDLIFKAEQILRSEVTFNFKNKSAALIMQKMSPEDFIFISVKIMPRLLDKIEMFSNYCENLLESNNWIYDSRGLYVQGSCEVKLAMAAAFKFMAEIIFWRGFQNSNSKLLKDFLSVLTSRKNSNRVPTNVDSLGSLVINAVNYLATFRKTILVLSGSLSIVKFFQVCVQYSSEPCSVLADLCYEFLCRNWFTVTGAPERGSIYNQSVDFLLKTYFSSVENKLEIVRITAKIALNEIGGLKEKDSALKTFKTITKSNFTLLYRTMNEALVSASISEFAKIGDDNEKELMVWNKIVETLLILVETAKVHSSRNILASLLKRSQSIIQLFLNRGMPVVESALRVKSVEVLTLLKSFQTVTRFLHSICCQSRITSDSVVAAHVPIIRSQCERLTLEVKGMLILNGIPTACITIAILKNRDIKGNDIISQETPDEDSDDDDSDLPPEDTPDAEENLNKIGSTNEGESHSSQKAVEFAAESTAEEFLKKPKLCCSTRLMFSIACFVAVFSASYVRIGISMALVCMIIPEGKNRDLNDKRGEFAWSSTTKGYLISAAFYGFVVGPFVAGFLSFKVGGKIVLVIGTIGTGVTNFFAPEAARVTPILFFVVRVITGFFASFTFPAFYDLVSHWIVPEERQLLVIGALVGIPAASILNFPISSVICDYFGWVWLFYILAIWMVLSGIIYIFVVFNNPDNCSFISEKELLFLKSRIPKTGKHKIPWKKIVKSLPIHAYFVIHFCINYVYLTLIFSLPLLMKSVHHFPLQENGLLSATPFLGSFTVRILLSLFFEQLRKKFKLSKNTLRKIFVCAGAILVSLFLLITTFLSYSYRYWVLGCFIIASSSLELCLSGGYLLSLLDLCPSYVNVLTGIANTVGNAAGLISPIVNGLITPHGTREEWNAVFYVNISILLGAMIFYLVFGQNDLQYWGLATLPSKAPVPRLSVVN